MTTSVSAAPAHIAVPRHRRSRAKSLARTVLGVLFLVIVGVVVAEAAVNVGLVRVELLKAIDALAAAGGEA